MKNYIFVLLLFIPSLYADGYSPALAIEDLLSDRRQTFSSIGHPKAAGVRFALIYPQSWKAREALGRNVIQMFQSDGGRGGEVFLVVITPTDASKSSPVKKEDLEELFSEKSLRSLVPSEDAQIITIKRTQLAGYDAGYVECVMPWEQANIKTLRYMQCYTLHPSADVVIQIMMFVNRTAVEGVAPELSKAIHQNKPLFTMLVSSINFEH